MDAHDEVIPRWRDYQDESLEGAFQAVMDHLRTLAPPPKLVGDLLVLLKAGRARIYINRGDASNRFAWGVLLHRLINGRRWKILSTRLSAFRKQRRHQHAVWEPAIFFAGKTLTTNLLNEGLPDGQDSLDIANKIAERFLERGTDPLSRQKSVPSGLIVSKYLLVMIELMGRAHVPNAIEFWINADLVKRCLDVTWIKDHFEPRQLQIVPRPGEERFRARGDRIIVRGVTKKIREEQIPKILPVEYSLLGYHDREVGLQLTYDKIINRSPLIIEESTPERPETRHRICLAFIIGLDPETTPEDACNHCRCLAFRLLIHAALKVPKAHIQADVVWIERRQHEWIGSHLPLSSILAKLDDSKDDHNVLEINRLLPYFFIKSILGADTKGHHDVKPIGEPPAVYLKGLVSQHLYRGIYVTALIENEQRDAYLPPASLALPRPDRGIPSVMMIDCDAEKEAPFRAELFDDILASRMAKLPLGKMKQSHILNQFLTMIIGEKEERRNVVPTV